jgi:hypothetical protein
MSSREDDPVDLPPAVQAYVDGLAAPKQPAMRQLLQTVAAAMPQGYELGLHWGMPTWVIPLATYPDTYNGQPLAYVSLASTKAGYSIYLMALYGVPEAKERFREQWIAAGKRFDMGKSCLRVRGLDDVDLDLLAEAVRAVPVDKFLATYERIKPARS